MKRPTVRGCAIAMTGAVLAAFAGCSTAPGAAPVLLTLPPTAASATAAGAGAAAGVATNAPLLAVRRVNIPEYLVSRRVRYRADPSTLAEWPNTFWAERIEIGVSREFTAALRQQLPGWSLCDTQCPDQAPALALQVDLVPMDYLRSARVLKAGARVTLSDTGAAPKVLQTIESSHEVLADADTAQAQAQAISALIRQVAASAAGLVRQQRAP